MNCSDYKSEYEERGTPSEEMIGHIAQCDDCDRFLKDDAALTALINELPSRTAPPDFGVAVRSRIERRKGGPSGIWAFARVAVPAAAMGLIVGFAVLNSDMFDSGQPSQNDTAVKIEPVTPPVLENDPSDELHVNDPESAPESVTVPDSNTELAGRIDDPPNGPNKGSDDGITEESAVKNKSAIRSIDSADQAFDEVETTNPPGLEPGNRLEGADRAEKKTFTDREILSALGLGAVWSGNRLRVTSVALNSVAQRSGVRVGDEVISIDGRSVSKGAAGRGNVKGLVLKIMRKGKTMNLSIR